MRGEKTGGRQRGTPNKLTFQTHQVLINVLNAELCNLPSLLDQLSPPERIDAVCKLSKFALPPLNSVSCFEAEKNRLIDEAKAARKINEQQSRDDLLDNLF